MNISSMNGIWTYYIRHVVMITSDPIRNSLPWPHGKVKCPCTNFRLV